MYQRKHLSKYFPSSVEFNSLEKFQDSVAQYSTKLLNRRRIENIRIALLKDDEFDNFETDDIDSKTLNDWYKVTDWLLTDNFFGKVHKLYEMKRSAPKDFKERLKEINQWVSGHKEEDILPETVAALLESDEKGLSMKSFPEEIYNKLFPDDKENPLVKVTKTLKGEKGPLIPIASVKPKHGIMENQDAGFLDFFSPKDENIEGIPESVIHGEEGGNTAELTGYAAQDLPEDFYVYLATKPPLQRNFVQLRGSVQPQWFPGYLFALPKSSDTICTNSPYEVFEQGWRNLSPLRCCNPKGATVVGT